MANPKTQTPGFDLHARETWLGHALAKVRDFTKVRTGRELAPNVQVSAATLARRNTPTLTTTATGKEKRTDALTYIAYDPVYSAKGLWEVYFNVGTAAGRAIIMAMLRITAEIMRGVDQDRKEEDGTHHKGTGKFVHDEQFTNLCKALGLGPVIVERAGKKAESYAAGTVVAANETEVFIAEVLKELGPYPHAAVNLDARAVTAKERRNPAQKVIIVVGAPDVKVTEDNIVMVANMSLANIIPADARLRKLGLHVQPIPPSADASKAQADTFAKVTEALAASRAPRPVPVPAAA